MDYRNRSSHRKIVLLRITLPPKPVAEMSQTQQRLAREFVVSAFRKADWEHVSSAGNGRMGVGQ
jgi:predicted RNA methylase